MEKLKNTRILGCAGLICSFLGVIMPYFSVTIFGHRYDITLWNYWEGKVIMALIIANLLFIFKDFTEKYAPQMFHSNVGQKIKDANPKMAIIPSICIAAFVIILFIRVDLGTSLKHGLGFFALWLGIICLVAHSLIYKNSNDTNSYHEQISDNQRSESTKVTIMDSGHIHSQTANVSQVYPQHTVANQNKKYCPQCRNQVNANAEVCFMCGNKF